LHVTVTQFQFGSKLCPFPSVEGEGVLWFFRVVFLWLNECGKPHLLCKRSLKCLPRYAYALLDENEIAYSLLFLPLKFHSICVIFISSFRFFPAPHSMTTFLVLTFHRSKEDIFTCCSALSTSTAVRPRKVELLCTDTLNISGIS